MENRKRSQQRRWRKWDVSGMKVTRFGWKWKFCGNAASREAIWWYERDLKERVTGAALSKRPSAAQRQLHPRSTSSPLPSVDSTSAKTGFEVCFTEGVPCNAHRASFKSVTDRASQDPASPSPALSPRSLERFWWCQRGQTDKGRWRAWHWAKKYKSARKEMESTNARLLFNIMHLLCSFPLKKVQNF